MECSRYTKECFSPPPRATLILKIDFHLLESCDGVVDLECFGECCGSRSANLVLIKAAEHTNIVKIRLECSRYAKECFSPPPPATLKNRFSLTGGL